MKINTFLPLFPGFYNTLLEADEEYEMDNVNETREELGLPPAKWEDFQWDYAGHNKKVAKNACHYVEKVLGEMGLPVKIKFQEIWSPKEYNFVTDDVYIEITLPVRKLRALFNECECAQYLEDKHKSRPGFISFYPYSKEWWSKCKIDKTTTGCILETILACHENTEWDDDAFYEAAMQDVMCEALNYEELTTKQDIP